MGFLQRTAVIFSTLSSVVNGIISYGCTLMAPRDAFKQWQLLFICVGAITFLWWVLYPRVCDVYRLTLLQQVDSDVVPSPGLSYDGLVARELVLRLNACAELIPNLCL